MSLNKIITGFHKNIVDEGLFDNLKLLYLNTLRILEIFY